jgi:hypothetical protein
MSRDEFAAAVREAMARLRLDQSAVSQRVGEPLTRVNDWLHARRAISEEKQARILEAIERGAPTVASMLADYERDVLARLGKLRSDLTTLMAPSADADRAAILAATAPEAVTARSARPRRKAAK